MKAVIVLCALLGVSFGSPTGKSAYSAYTAPAVGFAPATPAHVSFAPVTYTRTVSAPAAYTHVSSASHAYAPARAYYSGPVVTGSLHHSQDTYGQYKFGYSSSDGQAKTESRSGDGGVSGSYSYTSPEGKQISLAYKADKDGFKAYGDHLPEAPEVPDIPDYLADAYQDAHDRLAQAYAEASYKAPAVSYDDGSYRKHVSGGSGTYVTYSAPSYDDGSRYTAGYDDGSYRPDDEGSYERYAALYDDGSYKPSVTGSYRRYQVAAVRAPSHTYRTYSTGVAAARPARIYYGGAVGAAPAHSSVTYSTTVGGTPVRAPVVTSAALTAAAPHGKSGYAYHG